MGSLHTRSPAKRPFPIQAVAVGLATFFCFLIHSSSVKGQNSPPDEIRAIIEGTWKLVEWHVDGRILRIPEMSGRWMVHDGVVMATRHRQGTDGYESTAGYGTYRWGATSWTYGYQRSEDRVGSSGDEATLRVSQIPMRTFEIRRVGDRLILEDRLKTLRWEYDISAGTFLLQGRNQQPIRKYRRID